MNEHQLEMLSPRKFFTIDQEGHISIESKLFGNGEYNASDIKIVYISKPRFLINGELYLSINGDKHDGNILEKTTGFLYTRKETDNVKEVINLMEKINEDIEIKEFKAPFFNEQTSDKDTVRAIKCNSKNVIFSENNMTTFTIARTYSNYER